MRFSSASVILIAATAPSTVFGMINWSPALLSTLGALLHPLSHPTSAPSIEHLPTSTSLASIVPELSSAPLPLASAIKTTVDGEQGNYSEDDSIVVVVNPDLHAIIDSHLSAEESTEIQDANVDFVGAILPPPRLHPIGSAPSMSSWVESTTGKSSDINNEIASEGRVDNHAKVAEDTEGDDIPCDEPVTPTKGKQVIALEERLRRAQAMLRAVHRESTSYLIPTEAWQWYIFAGSFCFTMLLVLGRVFQCRRNARALFARRCAKRAEEWKWEGLKVAGQEVGTVQRKLLRRGQSVWLAVHEDGKDTGRMEQVWLEESVGIRGREKWEASMV